VTKTDDTTDAASQPDGAGADGAGATDSTRDDAGLSYGRALDELESLLSQLEAADVDVDRLTQQVARGVELVRFCRQRLSEVTADVDQVVADLMNDPGTESAAESATNGGGNG
jgi:exodeoxyribonuclease VII small subunit